MEGERSEPSKMSGMAVDYAHVSLLSNLCIKYTPEAIAFASVHMATRAIKFRVSKWERRKRRHTYWWDMFRPDYDVFKIEYIGDEFIDVIKLPDSSNKSMWPHRRRMSFTPEPTKFRIV